jgi:monoamine oxidase
LARGSPGWPQPSRLHFAGDYASYKFNGFMEGALSSGAAIARRIGERDRLAAP